MRTVRLQGLCREPYRERVVRADPEITLVDARSDTEAICDVCFCIRPLCLMDGTTCVDCS